MIARLLGDLASNSQTAAEPMPRDLVENYDSVLCRAGAADLETGRDELPPVLCVLAAASVDPILPIKLLCVARGRSVDLLER